MNARCDLAMWACGGGVAFLLAASAVLRGADDLPVKPGTCGPFPCAGDLVASQLSVPSDYDSARPMPLIISLFNTRTFAGHLTLADDPLLDATQGKGYLVITIATDQVREQLQNQESALPDAWRHCLPAAIARTSALSAVDPARVILADTERGNDALEVCLAYPPSSSGFYGVISLFSCTGFPNSYTWLRTAESVPMLIFSHSGDAEEMAETSEGFKSAGAIVTTYEWPSAEEMHHRAPPSSLITQWLTDLPSHHQRAQAERPVIWQRAAPTGTPAWNVDDHRAFIQFLVNQPLVRHASTQKPILVFITSHAGGPSDMDASHHVEDALFHYPTATEVPMLAHGFFTTIELDCSDVAPGNNRILNATMAPVVVMLDRNRKVAAEFRGAGRITERDILTNMHRMLDGSAASVAAAAQAKLVPMLKEMRASHDTLAQMETTLDQMRAHLINPRTGEYDVPLMKEIVHGIHLLVEQQRHYTHVCEALVAALP